MRIVQPSVSLEWITPNALEKIELAGRTCYKSEDKAGPSTAEKFCVMIKQRGHESVVEHAVASFRIVCDRGVSHEIVRHRIASISQASTRYCNYSKGKFGGQISVIEPPGLSEAARNIWIEAMKDAEAAYLYLIQDGATPQIARSVLPNSLATELVFTANFREWLHFIDLRTSPAAHPQMREIAFMIEEQLINLCPAIFKREKEFKITLSQDEHNALKQFLLIADDNDMELNPTLFAALRSVKGKVDR